MAKCIQSNIPKTLRGKNCAIRINSGSKLNKLKLLKDQELNSKKNKLQL